MGNSQPVFRPRDLTGKVALVTGGNSGLGFITALELARHHAHVFVTCRDATKGQETVKAIQLEVPDAQVDYLLVELSSLASVRQLAADFRSKSLPLHLLINNAGIMNVPYGTSADGYELQFAVNHLSHFLLTLSLLDILKSSGPSKVINLSSGLYTFGQANWDGVDSKPKSYAATKFYGRSKLANILFTYELARRMEGTEVTVNAIDPGIVATNLARHMSAGKLINAVLATSPKVGVLTTLAVAADASSDGVTGRYWKKSRPSNTNRQSLDREAQKELWDRSLAWANIEADPTVSQSLD